MMQEMGDGGVCEKLSLEGCHKLFRNFKKLFFYHYPIYLVILQVVRICPIPNHYLELYIYSFELFCFYKLVQFQISWHLAKML
jgi:hypothetical protein